MNIKAIPWIGFIAARYVSRGRRNSPTTVFSVLGIATGVLALIVIIAVMNGFQLGFIESILEISSGHLRVENFPAGETGEDLQNSIRALPGLLSAVPFRETNVLMRGRLASSRGAVLRGLPPDALERDLTLAAKLEIEDGYFDLDYPNGIVLGAELARYLSVRAGDQVTVLSISGGFSSSEDEEEGGSLQYTVTGIFRCGYYEYDLGWAYININKAAELAPENSKPILEIKLKDRWQDRRSMDSIGLILERTPLNEGEETPTVISWRDYNRAFFGALRTEKLMMFILVGLIFIVVGLNIFQAQRRTVLERREEIGLLRALGASELAVRLIFVWDGLVIGLAGAGLGLVLGLFVAFHIPAFFTFLEGLVNLFINAVNGIASLLGSDPDAQEFAVFSPQVFYIKEIPSRVIPHEVILIFLFGFLSALAAAWFASMKASRTRPSEVLRYE